MLNVLARLRHGFYQRLCGLLCAVILVVGLFGCSPPTITLDLLTSLNARARVQHSCHRVYGSYGQLHYGVQKGDQNQIITEDTPERIIDAVKTADVITLYAPDSPACSTKSRVHFGVFWTRASPTHELPELYITPTMREALESSLTQAFRAEPGSINKEFFGQLTTWRDPRLTMQQAETITHTVRQALRGHVNDLLTYGPLGPGFAEANRKLLKQDAPKTTVEPIDTPQAQFVGGALAEIGPAVAPGGALVTQALIDQGVLPRGTREAQAGKAATDIVVGAAQVFIGADGAIIGGGMSLTGAGAVAGVPLCIGSLALAVNGAVTAWNGAQSLTIVLCRWEDLPAAGASPPAPAPATAAPPAAKPVQAPVAAAPPKATAPPPAVKPPQAPPASQQVTTTKTWNKRTPEQTTTTTRSASGTTTTTLVKPPAGDYRGRYDAARVAQGKSQLPNDWAAHHRIPQKYRKHPEFKGFDFDAPSNIQGVKGPKADVNVHQKITNLWTNYQKTNPNATQKQIEDFARSIDVKFQNDWWK